VWGNNERILELKAKVKANSPLIHIWKDRKNSSFQLATISFPATLQQR